MNTIVVAAKFIPEHTISRCLDCKYHSRGCGDGPQCGNLMAPDWNYIPDEQEIPDWCPFLKKYKAFEEEDHGY